MKGTVANKRQKSLFRLVAILGIFVGVLNAQNGSDSPQARDTNGKADQNIRSAARINPATLAMEFSLPMMNYPGRGGSVPFGLSYSSKVWRMDDYVTYSYPLPYSNVRQYVTLLRPIFAERTAGGWSSLLSFPSIEERLELFGQDGGAYNFHETETEYQNSFQAALTLNAPGQQPIPPMPPDVCGWRCTGYYCEYIDGRFINCTCGNWSFLTAGCEPGGGLPPPNPTHYVKRVHVRLDDGTTTEFRKDESVHSYCVGGYNDGPGCNGNTSGADNLGDFLSVDGSGARLNRTTTGSTLYLPNGRKIFFGTIAVPGANQTTHYYATESVDADGNRISYTEAGSGASTVRTLIDTMGRQLRDPLPRNFSQQNQTEGEQAVSLPGFGGDQSYTFKWRHLEPVPCGPGNTTNCGNPEGALDTGLTTDYYTSNFCFGNQLGPEDPYPSNGVLFPSHGPGLRSCNPFTTSQGTYATSVGLKFNPVVLAEVVLPNGKSYTFRYNQFGEIVKLTHPTGSFERFHYQFIPPMSGANQGAYDQVNRGVTDHSVYHADGQLAGRTKYSAMADLGGGVYTTTSTVPHQNSQLSAEPNGMRTVRKMYASDPNDVKFGFETALAGMAFDEQTFDENQSLRSRVLTRYKVESTSVGSTNYPGIAVAERDARPEKTVSITFDGGLALASLTTLVYDVPAAADRKYFSHLNIKSKQSTHFASVPVGAASAESLSWTAIESWFASTPLATRSETDYKYTAQGGDPYMNRGIIGMAMESRAVNPSNPSQILSKTQPVYDESNYLVTDYNCTLAGDLTNTWINPSTTVRGKVTTARIWNADTNSWLETRSQYDQYGNIRKVWDVVNNLTETVFSNTYGCAYPISAIAPAPDPTNTHGTNQTSTSQTSYDFTSGFPVSVTDDFGQTVTTEYNDPLLRPTGVSGAGIAEVDTDYDDTARTVTVRKQIDGTNWDEAITYSDTLGRPIKTVAKDSQGDVIVETKYDILGRIDMVSNPYRQSLITSNAPIQWSKSHYDELGRLIQTFAPAPNGSGGATLGLTSFGLSSTGIIGSVVTTTDASGRQSRSITNALGQLMRVDEPSGTTGAGDLGSITSPNQPTSYTYDPYGNMVMVQQGGQQRNFKYNALGRLIRVKQPEQQTNPSLALPDTYNASGQWTAAFTYDDLGNVITATDARGVTVTNTYDSASRVKTRTYSGEIGTSTLPVSFYYDGKGLSSLPYPNYTKGKLTKVTNGPFTTEYMSFDNLGRLTRSKQIPDDVIYGTDQSPMTYSYNLSGALVEETYPSGRVVRHTYESDGDLSTVTSRKSGSNIFKQYASNFLNTASGGISQMKLGNGKWETAEFNERAQVKKLGLGASAADTAIWKTNYEYGELDANGQVNTGQNTGNIAKQTLIIPGASSNQWYKYDPLHRLAEARETTGSSQTNNWIQNWTYDRYGNRQTFTQNIGGNTFAPHHQADQQTNKFTDPDFVYDKNGNVTRDRDGINNQLRTFKFNGENKQTEVLDANNAVVGQYFYDGEGKRVKKVVTATGETTVFVYSAGKLVGEYSTIVAPPQSAKISYTTTDHLGSPRVITDDWGQVMSRRDFLPYGEEIYAGIGGRTGESGQGYSSATDKVRQKFTGYQKDIETSLDFAEARMYENRYGRFTAVDPLLASGKSANPQTFNRFAYVGGNPLNITDPTGLIWYFNQKLNRYDWYDEEKKKFKWTGGDLTDEWSRTTEGVGAGHFVYERDGGWAALDPNSSTFSRWSTQTQAAFEYGAYSNYGGYGNIPVYGTVLTMVSGIKTGNVERAIYGFGVTSATLATAPRTFAGLVKEGGSEVLSYFSGLPIFNPKKLGLKNEELIQKAANIAHKRVDEVGRFAGIAKHEYSTELLRRHQRRFGDNGLSFKQYFNNGPGNRGVLDVLDTRNNVIYDWKFVNPSVSTQTLQNSSQMQKYRRNFGFPTEIIRPEKW
ncbi:MAG: RHS repeat protein [Acidobacteria bacterium]|nr:RHS repeat protein [Acidobacteriota bacterium]